jgi:membrane associated rhomboid family serine protease
MPTGNDPFLLFLLQACAELTPQPLYPARFAKETNLDRDKLELALDELRKRGLLKFTDWVKGLGQGYALTDAGQQAHQTKRLLWSAASEADKPKASAAVSTYERGETVRAVFLEPATPYVSRILLAMNLLYFGYGAFLATKEPFVVGDYLTGQGDTTGWVLHKLGAVESRQILADQIRPGERPQYERLILGMFLHVGVIHLFMNMYFLISLGPLIESMWGSVRFLAIYFIAGFTSSCLVVLSALWWGHSGQAAGASGALFGIFAALVVWFLLNRQHLPERVVQGMSRNLAINLVLLTAINFVSGVSWQGHLGGAIGGLLAALLLHVQRFHPSAIVRTLALLAVPLVPIGFFAAMLWID